MIARLPLIALAAVIALPVAATPAIATPIATPVAAPASDLDRLVLLMLPDQRIMDLVTQMVRNDNGARSELKDPATREFVIARMLPEVSKVMRAELPGLRAEIAGIISADLSPDEITDIYTFFASPTGQKLQQILFEEMGKNPGADGETIQKRAVERFMASMTADDYPALSAFGASSGAPKMRDLTPRVGAASEAWADRLLKKHGPRFDGLRAEAIADYKRQKDAQ